MDNNSQPQTNTSSATPAPAVSAQPVNLQSTVYILMGRGTKSSKQGALSFNGSNIMLTLQDGHVVFDEPLANILELEIFNSDLIVHMPTGDAYIYFADPNGVADDLMASAATGLIGGVAGAAAGVGFANKAVNEMKSQSGTIQNWETMMTGKVKIKGSSNTDIGNTKKGVFSSVGILMMLFGGLWFLGSFSLLSEYRNYAIPSFAISALMIVLGYLLYRKASGASRVKTVFPSSR